MKEMDNLTRDVLAAEAAGFGPNYGDYIAQYGHTSKPEPPKIDKKRIVCQLCGCEFFVSNNLHRKYCSADCREKARLRQESASRKKKLERMSACAASPE